MSVFAGLTKSATFGHKFLYKKRNHSAESGFQVNVSPSPELGKLSSAPRYEFWVRIQENMPYFKHLALLGALLLAVGKAPAQVSVGIDAGSDYRYSDSYSDDYPDAYSDDYSSGYADAGAEPVCPYGYYAYYPYACAPYGYYGPSYFIDGIFIGAGPWYPSYYGGGYYGAGGYGGYSGYDYRSGY